MRQRKRFGVVLLLVAGLMSLPSRPVPAQDGPSIGDGPGSPADGGHPPIIATSKTAPLPVISGTSALPPLDDGQSSSQGREDGKGTSLPPPPSPAVCEIQEVGFLTGKPKDVETKPGGIPAVLPPVSVECLAGESKWDKGAALAIYVAGPENAMPGQVIGCLIRVKNTGTQVVTAVAVELPVSTGVRLVPKNPEAELVGESLRWKVGNLEPSQERVLRFEFQSSQPGEVHLRPVATFGPATGLRTSMIQAPFSLSVSGPKAATLGEKLVFDVRVGNPTPSPIANVNLLCELSDGLYHPLGREVMTDLGEPLLPGQVRSVPLETLARAMGRQQVTVNATAVGGQKGQASWSVPVSDTKVPSPRAVPGDSASAASLSLKTLEDRLAINGETMCEVRLSNQGPADLHAARLVVQLPEGLDLVEAEGPTRLQQGGKQIVFAPMDELRPRLEALYRLRVRAVSRGDWTVRAELTATGLAKPVQASGVIGMLVPGNR